MRKVIFLFDAMRIFAMVVCACAVAFLASCDPDPVVPISVIDHIEVNVPELVNRETTDEAGRFVYTDKVSITGKVFYKVGDETESQEVKKEVTLTSEATWSAGTTSINALTGEIAKRATITASEAGVTLDFGAFKADNYVAFTNTSYTFTHEGESVEMSFYGFDSASVSTDAVVKTAGLTEGERNYLVTTVTQAFQIKHSDGTEKEITGVFEYREDVTGTERKLIGYEEISRRVREEQNFRYATYVIRHYYNFGDPVDKEVTVEVGVGVSNVLRILGVYFLERDWTLAKFESVGYEVTRENTYSFKDWNFSEVRKQHTYESSFKKDRDSRPFELEIAFNENSFVSGGLPPLKLSSPVFSATADVVLKSHTGYVYDEDGVPVWDTYLTSCNLYVTCDGMFVKMVTATNVGIYIQM